MEPVNDYKVIFNNATAPRSIKAAGIERDPDWLIFIGGDREPVCWVPRDVILFAERRGAQVAEDDGVVAGLDKSAAASAMGRIAGALRPAV
jgi:hypothetical protein